MHAKTEEFLNTLLWAMDMFSRPTLRNLTSSYEQWAYRNGFEKQVRSLQKSNLIARDHRAVANRIYSLTNEGRLQALGGRDPEECWSRPWDGVWRVVLFDLPNGNEHVRDKFRRYLRMRNFGGLQKSVWICPDPVPDFSDTFKANDVRSVVVLESRPARRGTHEMIVDAAWPWDRINDLYAQHLKVLDQRPKQRLTGEIATRQFRRWAALERQAWLTAIRADPLLPERLLPRKYLGRKSWAARREMRLCVGDQLLSFIPSAAPK